MVLNNKNVNENDDVSSVVGQLGIFDLADRPRSMPSIPHDYFYTLLPHASVQVQTCALVLNLARVKPPHRSYGNMPLPFFHKILTACKSHPCFDSARLPIAPQGVQTGDDSSDVGAGTDN
ncbi:hypothetical protein CHS0354_027100 [Potamilus streckersoni]|uniref:Uncharacterized protein n=1 Tax=Potamilus streckersoni TaxID=2493646 RepID=A0AAE0VN54_9BIVA|nr:hypothetical protein CHS0354_027100 [Potamilus streckersoni]